MKKKIKVAILDYGFGNIKSLSNALNYIGYEVSFFTKNKEKYLVAAGGKRGLGNVRFKSSTNRAPKKKTSGKLGEEFWIWFQLKVIADIGIIGKPNAGKSSLLAALTKAKPKIANYPFTTINPNLGVTYYDGKEVTLADIPGLVEGAHKGVGLGDKFLRHIERCKVLLHLIDLSETDLVNSYKKIKLELSTYDKMVVQQKFFEKKLHLKKLDKRYLLIQLIKNTS